MRDLLVSEKLTCVFILGFVHLSIGTFSSDPNDFKLVHASLSPIYLSLLNLSKAWATYSTHTKKRNVNLAIHFGFMGKNKFVLVQNNSVK